MAKFTAMRRASSRLSSLAVVQAGYEGDGLERLRYTVTEGETSKATTAMANLAEAIQGLVQHMRAEQQMIRDWAEAQAKLNGEIRRFMEILARDSVHM